MISAERIGHRSEPAVEKVVTFKIDDRNFGIDVTKVREIKGWQPVTPLPHTEEGVLGVLNLRGIVVPIHDLRAKFGMAPVVASDSHVVIVVDVEGQTIGLLADSVSDILPIAEGELRPSPNVSEMIRELVVKPDSIIALLSLPAMLHREAV